MSEDRTNEAEAAVSLALTFDALLTERNDLRAERDRLLASKDALVRKVKRLEDRLAEKHHEAERGGHGVTSRAELEVELRRAWTRVSDVEVQRHDTAEKLRMARNAHRIAQEDRDRYREALELIEVHSTGIGLTAVTIRRIAREALRSNQSSSDGEER